MVKELFALARKGQEKQERKIPWFRSQQWYFFFIAVLFVYGRFVKNNLIAEMSLIQNRRLHRFLGWVLSRHTFICFALYVAGYVAFVLNLKKGMYMYQFGQYAWTHMICFLMVVPSSFFVSNIFECGILWFVLPAVLIMLNDIMAYFFGFYFGKTPLISLSPKKTWEGFLGALVSVVWISFYITKLFTR
jgi:phosphatidate cytidylyltransferase